MTAPRFIRADNFLTAYAHGCGYLDSATLAGDRMAVTGTLYALPFSTFTEARTVTRRAKTNASVIRACGVAPDPARPFHGVAPFFVAPGRIIVDNAGAHILAVQADGISYATADDNAHAIAAALNVAHGWKA